MDPLITVLVPVFNCERYVEATVRSILAQSYRNIELIVVDDGSTDRSGELLHTLAAEDGRIRYLSKENGGQASARNLGLRAARGEYVAFCDADDLWEPEKLELQYRCLERGGAEVCYSDVRFFDDGTGLSIQRDANERTELRRGEVLPALLVYNFITHSSLMVRRSCFAVAGDFDESIRMGDDWDLLLRLASHFRFDFVDQKLVRYRVARAGQVSGNIARRFHYWDQILRKYCSLYPHLVSDRLLKRARASLLVNQAWCLRNSNALEAARCYLEVIRLEPGNLKIYLSLLKTCLLGVLRQPLKRSART